MKVNNGHAFLHPVTGVMIGPGQIYSSFDKADQAADKSREDLTTKKKSSSKTTAAEKGEAEDGTNVSNNDTSAGDGGSGTTV